MREPDPSSGQRLDGGYLNRVVRHATTVRKTYVGAEHKERRRVELHALTCLAGLIPVPTADSGGDYSLDLEFVTGRNGQRLMNEGRAGLALRLCGAVLRRLQAVDTRIMDGGLPGAGSVIVHGDFGPQNVLIRPADAAVSAVVDWEFCHLGTSIEDIAWAEWIVRRHQRSAVRFLPELFAGYGCEPPWTERRRSMLDSLRLMRSFAMDSGDARGVALWDERIGDTAAWGRSEFLMREEE